MVSIKEKKEERRGLPKLAIGIVAAFLIVFIGILFFIQISSFNKYIHYKPPKPPPNINVSFSIFRSGLAYYNSKNISGYAIIKYSMVNATSALGEIGVFGRDPLPSIYVINTSGYCIKCFNQTSFFSNLSHYLYLFGLLNSSLRIVNYPELKDLNSSSLLIVPTGLIPYFLLFNNYSIFYLLKRGVTIVYVGSNFSASIGPNGVILITPQNLTQAFNQSNLLTSRFYFQKKESVLFHNPTFGFYHGYSYGNVSATNSYNGTFIAFSNYPIYGWNNASEMAYDIANVLYSRFFDPTFALGRVSFNSSNPAGTLGLFATNMTVPLNSTNLQSVYLLTVFGARNGNSFLFKSALGSTEFPNKAAIGLQGLVPESYPIPTYLLLNSTSQYSFSLNVYNSNFSLVDSIPLGFFNTSTGIIKYLTFNFPPGGYIAQLVNIYGQTYAQAVFLEDNVTIEPIKNNFLARTFLFQVSSGGIPLNNTPYTISLDGIYKKSGVVTGGIINYTLPQGSAIGYGTHIFNLTINGKSYYYLTEYQKKIFKIPLIYIEMLIAVIFVIILNLVVKAPERDEYYIDVPDIIKKTSSSTTIKLKREDVLSVFDKVNAYYRWKFMPLSPEEFRNGLSTNLRYAGLSVSITSKNAEDLLVQLVTEGLLQEFGNYYAPTKWINATGHNIEYLYVFRKLRDFFVTNAILFTDLDSSKEADIVITIKGVQKRVIIYAGHIRDFEIEPSIKVYIVFSSYIRKAEFEDFLSRSFSMEAEALKSAIEKKYVVLVDLDHLNELR
ncbi:MAG: hypothetical protein QXL16_01110 [Candidatus Micrarchaeaceae archaeon]